MKAYLQTVILLAAFFAVSGLSADTQGQQEQGTEQVKPERTEEKPAAYPWSVGAGIGLSVYRGTVLGSTLGMGGYNYGSAVSPFGVVLVEKQLSDHLALTFGASGNYQKRSLDDGERGNYFEPDYGYYADASVGVRWIFNPNGPVEVSGNASIAGLIGGIRGNYYQYVTDENLGQNYVKTEYEQQIYGLGCELGIAFERKLMDNLFLRFQTALVQANVGKTIDKYGQTDETNDTVEGRSVNVGFAFTPSIQLRLEI